MIGEKRSRSRRRWKTDNPRAGDSIVEHLEYASYSFENETANLIGNRASNSGGKTGNSRRRGKQTSDESEAHADSDNLTYTKDAPETIQKSVGSPVNSILKVEEYLTRHERLDDDRVKSQKRQKSGTKGGENIVKLGLTRIEAADAHDVNRLLPDKGESGSLQSHAETKQKRRKWQKIQREKSSNVGFSAMIEDDARDEDERETERPEDYLETKEKRWKSKQERDEKNRVLESIEAIEDDAGDENGGSSERREIASPENNQERREKRRRSREEEREKSRVLDFNATIAGDEDGGSSERRESVSPENNLESREKQRKSRREEKEKNRVLDFNATIAGDEDGGSTERRESASPENNLERREKRRKSRREEREKSRVLDSNATIVGDEDGGSSERRESASPENNLESREKRRKSRREEKEKNRVLDSNATIALDEDGGSSERRESASPENNLESREKRRKSRRERKEKNHKMASSRTLEDEEMPDDDRRESGSPENDMERRERRRKSRRLRKEKNRTLESGGTLDEDARAKLKKPDEPRISRRRKRRRSKADSTRRAEKQERELPITEILRKAQEDSRNRYDEPVALPELTTDTIYVQGRNGFSAVKLAESRGARGRRRSPSRETTLYPIKVAIVAQSVWNSTGLIHQGLLAGMALMHLILIQTFFQLSLDFLFDYSLIAELYTNIFSFLVTMCVVSVFDKFDLAHLDLAHLREIYVEHSRSFLAVPLYLSAFCLHQATLLVDDKVALMSYAVNATEFGSNSTESIIAEDLVTWQKVTLAKDGLAVLAWLFVALGPREDMLLTHLKTMEKFADSPESSRRDIVEAMRREHEKRAMNKKEQSVN